MFSRTDALAAGYTDDDLRRGRGHGELITVRRGYFVRADVFRTLDAHARHLLLAEAVHSESSSNVVLSHVSAAVLHGWETWDIPLDKVTLTVGRTYASKKGSRRVLHGSHIAADEVTTIRGFPVTTPARTVVDLARSLPLIPAVCVGDRALRSGSTTHDELMRALTEARTRTGIAKARQAVSFMTDRSKSVGESRSRMLLDTLPLPPPQLGRWVYDSSGMPVAPVTFLFPDHGVAALFEHSDAGSGAPVDLDRSRSRKHFADLGWVVVRWNWTDLALPRELTDRIARAFVQAASNRAPVGSVGSAPELG